MTKSRNSSVSSDKPSSSTAEDCSPQEREKCFHFALYSYKSQKSQGEKPDASAAEDFSLTQLAGDVAPENESRLRGALARRVALGSVYGGGTANVLALDRSACIAHGTTGGGGTGLVGDPAAEKATLSCYFFLLSGGATAAGGNNAGTSGHAGTVEQLVVCYVTDERGATLLDLHQTDLALYSEGVPGSEDRNAYMREWFDAALGYAVRVPQQSASVADLARLAHAALRDVPLRFTDTTEPVTAPGDGRDMTPTSWPDDVKRFYAACLSGAVLDSTDDFLVDLSDVSRSDAETAPGPCLDVTIEDGQLYFRLVGVSSCSTVRDGGNVDGKSLANNSAEDAVGVEANPFCRRWMGRVADLAAASSTASSARRQVRAAAAVKQSLEEMKLRIIHDMNSLKRVMKQAESDHHALYRAYVFMRQCGAGDVLAHHMRAEAGGAGGCGAVADAGIIDVVEEYFYMKAALG